MGNSIIGTNIVTQIGIIVRDVEKTAQAFAQFFGVEPPECFWTDEYAKAQTEYRGKPSTARAKLAFFDCGSLSIELIEPDEEMSTWREFLEQNGEGVHHIAFNVKGMGEKTMALSAQGFPLVQKGEYTGGRYAYFESTDQLKVLLELLEND